MNPLTAYRPVERHELTDAVRSIAWSPDDRPMALGADGRAWIASQSRLTAPIGADPICCCWLTVDRVAVVDGLLGVVIAGGGSVDTVPLHGSVSIASQVTVGGDGAARPSCAVVAGAEGVSVIHPDPRRSGRPSTIDTGPMRSVEHLGGSVWLAGGGDGLVVVDVALGCVDQRVDLPGVVALAGSPTSGRVAAADATGAVHVLDLAHLGDGVELTGYPDTVRLLDISPSGDVVVACADDELTWWGIDDDGHVDDQPACSVGHHAAISACSIGASGYVATGDLDGTVRLWSPQLRDLPLATLHLHSEVTELAWSRWGDRLAIGTVSGDLVIAEIDAGELL